jgi:hypothetical protein
MANNPTNPKPYVMLDMTVPSSTIQTWTGPADTPLDSVEIAPLGTPITVLATAAGSGYVVVYNLIPATPLIRTLLGQGAVTAGVDPVITTLRAAPLTAIRALGFPDKATWDAYLASLGGGGGGTGSVNDTNGNSPQTT